MSSPVINRNPRFSERSNSFNGKSGLSPITDKLRRPKTVPDLKSGMRNGVVSPSMEEFKSKRLTKVLVNVTIQGSVGTVQVLISPDLTVKDLIIAAIKQYAKEGRRPVLSCTNLEDFSLHYSQFSLESLDRDEKIAELGSRNFFLCKRNKEVEEASSCSTQAENVTKLGSPLPPWLKFMNFLF